MDQVFIANLLQELEIVLDSSKEGEFPALGYLHSRLCGQSAKEQLEWSDINFIWGVGENPEQDLLPPPPPSLATPPPPDSPALQSHQRLPNLGTRNCPKTTTRRKPQLRTIVLKQVVEPVHEDRPETEGQGWGTVSTVRLGIRSRNYIIRLAGQCNQLILPDLAKLIKSGVQAYNNLPNTLVEMNAHWKVSRDTHRVAQLWQSILEMLISIRCDMFNLGPGEIWDQKLSVPGLTPEQARAEKRSFSRLCTTGKKLCRLVGAGTLYILPLIVFSGLKSEVREMSIDEINEISMLLREVKSDESTIPLVSGIIQQVLELRKIIDFHLHTQASPGRCKMLKIPEIICASEIEDSDRFFDSLRFRDFILPQRSTDFWDIDYTPVPRDLVALGSLVPNLDDVDVIPSPAQYPIGEDTVFIGCSLRPSGFIDRIPKDSRGRNSWTSHQRDKASNGDSHILSSAQDLTTYLGNLPSLGKWENMLYRWISPDFEQGKSVHVTGVDGELLFLVIKSMPDKYRTKISQVIGAIYPEDWKHFSLGEASRVGFQADHFCCWNRYSEQGTDAPENIHPSHLMKLCQNANCPRRHRVPHVSQNIYEDGGNIYSQLSYGLADMFSWLSKEIQTRLPSHFATLTEVFCELPFQQDLVSYPFTNLIVNLGAETSGHTDPKDNGLCAVLPFGDWEGGELCLYEPGITLDLCAGDVVLFPSNQISHFNLCMEGYRGSMVLSTDRDMKGWVENRNNWASHIR